MRWIDILTDAGHVTNMYTYGDTASMPGHAVNGMHRHFRSAFTGDKWLRLPIWLRRQLIADNIDVALAVLEFSSIATMLAVRNTEVAAILVEHGMPSLRWQMQGRVGKIKKMLAGRLYPSAVAVVAVSHSVAVDLRVGVGVDPDRIYVLPNVMDLEAARQHNAAEYASAQSIRLLLVGRLVKEKNFLAAIEAAHHLIELGWETSIAVFGEGAERAALARAASQYQVQVEFRGWQRNWVEEARPGDVLVLTSLAEAFGNVLVEAACAGIPTVATSSALGVAEAVIPGVTGVLALTSSAPDVAEAVLKARDLDVSQCPEGWLKRFSPDSVAPSLLKIIERATLSPRSRSVVATDETTVGK